MLNKPSLSICHSIFFLRTCFHFLNKTANQNFEYLEHFFVFKFYHFYIQVPKM